MAAVAAYLDARANRGQWLIRMEDVDTARCSSHWADDILRTLEAFAFHWDRPVVYQTSPERQHAYESALHRLDDAGLVYPCACSRKQIAETQSTVDADGEIRYPGTGRNGLPPGALPRAWRVRVPDETIGFTDRVQGRFEQHLALSVGDFVLRRADGPFAYQLAVVVDDADQGITDVVRGVDLLASTPRQIYLQRLLRLPQPRYLHLPLVVTNDGEKLSKQTGAPPLRLDNPGHQLWEALDFLGQSPPADLKGARPEALWQWGIAAWNVGEDSNAAPVSNIEASRSKHVLAPLDAVAARFQKCLSNLSRDSIERTFTAAIARRNSPNARADDTEEQRPNR